MARIQTEHGMRNVQQDDYRGHRIEVVTGYEARSDRYPIHVYITGPTGVRSKANINGMADTMAEAFDHGFAAAQQLLDDQSQFPAGGVPASF